MKEYNGKFGWMPWGGGDAHGPFDSEWAALVDAREQLGLMPGETKRITINRIFKPDFLDYMPSAEDLTDHAADYFHSDCGGDDPMFDLACGHRDADALRQANKELREALGAWAAKWVEVTCDWWMQEGELTVING